MKLFFQISRNFVITTKTKCRIETHYIKKKEMEGKKSQNISKLKQQIEIQGKKQWRHRATKKYKLKWIQEILIYQ